MLVMQIWNRWFFLSKGKVNALVNHFGGNEQVQGSFEFSLSIYLKLTGWYHIWQPRFYVYCGILIQNIICMKLRKKSLIGIWSFFIYQGTKLICCIYKKIYLFLSCLKYIGAVNNKHTTLRLPCFPLVCGNMSNIYILSSW